MNKEFLEDFSTLRIVEDFIIGIVAFIFINEFLYKNYLMYSWHRGLEIPSRIPSYLIALIIVLGLAYLEYNGLKWLRNKKRDLL